jgi:hypothetical protein
MKKQSGTLRLHLRVRRHADTPTRRYVILCGCGSVALWNLRFKMGLGPGPVESEPRMHNVGSLINASFLDDDGYLYFGCGYHLNVDVGLSQ